MQNPMTWNRKLPTPDEVKAEFPLRPDLVEKKAARDGEIERIFTGEDTRMILIIGPCSADREDAVLDYIYRLCPVQEKVKDKLLLIPRIYTNKPRTTGDGYKGMFHQPDPTEKADMTRGVLAVRDLHCRALEETGFSCADEALYPENYEFLSDVLAYVAIGARSVENQQHRLCASGFQVPVGMKNPTSGDISVMLNSITAAQHPHVFEYRGWEVETSGNPLAHAILRGSVDSDGKNIPNYHYEDLIKLCTRYEEKNLQNPAIIVDANHSNSGKQYLEQIRICKEVLHSCRHHAGIQHMVKGFMIESYLVDGNQKVGGGCYGQSITDPCLGWEKTERLIYDLADLL